MSTGGEDLPRYLLLSFYDAAAQSFSLLSDWKEERGISESQSKLREACTRFLEVAKPEGSSLLYRSQVNRMDRLLSSFLEECAISKEKQVLDLLTPVLDLLTHERKELEEVWGAIETRCRVLERLARGFPHLDSPLLRGCVERLERMLSPVTWKSAASLLASFFAEKKEDLRRRSTTTKKRSAECTDGDFLEAPPKKRANNGPPSLLLTRGGTKPVDEKDDLPAAQEPDTQKHLQRHRKDSSAVSVFTRCIQCITEFSDQLRACQRRHNPDKIGTPDYDESVVCSFCPGHPCRIYANLGKSVCMQCGRSYRMNSQGNHLNGSIATLGYASNAMGGQHSSEDRSALKTTTSGVSYFRKRLQEVQGKGVQPALPRDEVELFKGELMARGITQQGLEKFKERPERFYHIMRDILSQDRGKKKFREMTSRPFAVLYHILGVRPVCFTEQEEKWMTHLFEELSPLTLDYAKGRSNNYGMELYMYDFMMRMGKQTWAVFFCQPSEFANSDFQCAVNYAYGKLGMTPTKYSGR